MDGYHDRKSRGSGDVHAGKIPGRRGSVSYAEVISKEGGLRRGLARVKASRLERETVLPFFLSEFNFDLTYLNFGVLYFDLRSGFFSGGSIPIKSWTYVAGNISTLMGAPRLIFLVNACSTLLLSLDVV